MRRALFSICALMGIQALVLHWQGRLWLCACGAIRFWVGDVNSAENSQQITDWYTFSHIEHGFLFYALLWLVARRLSLLNRLVIAVGFEAAWEILENSPMIIDRYRQTALANGYVGDTVLNSLSDT